MTAPAGFERITKDEAVAALREHAWTQHPPAEDCALAVDAIRELCASVPPGAGLTPAAVIAVIDGIVAAPRQRIHCRLGGLGADWDLDEAIKLIRSAEGAAWIPSLMRHDLAVKSDGDVYHFEARKPEPVIAPGKESR